IALVDTLDPVVKVGARTDQALGGLWQLYDDGRVAIRRVAEAPFRTTAVGKADLTGFDCPLGEQPGDDVHDAGRHLQGLAGEADTRERMQGRPVVSANVVEIMACF